MYWPWEYGARFLRSLRKNRVEVFKFLSLLSNTGTGKDNLGNILGAFNTSCTGSKDTGEQMSVPDVHAYSAHISSSDSLTGASLWNKIQKMKVNCGHHNADLAICHKLMNKCVTCCLVTVTTSVWARVANPDFIRTLRAFQNLLMTFSVTLQKQ